MDENTNSQILNALNAVSCRLSAIEQTIDRTKAQLRGQVQSGSDIASSLDVSTTPSQEMDEESDTLHRQTFQNFQAHTRGSGPQVAGVSQD